MTKMSTEKRFWSYVDKEGKSDYECWNWIGSTAAGYGKFKCKGKTLRTHRYAWELARKCKVPDGKCILHLCDNPLCCNPNHLYCGDQADNMRDRYERNRVNRASLSTTKFYEGEVWLMKKLYNEGLTYLVIAMMFRTTPETISRWVRDVCRYPKPNPI